MAGIERIAWSAWLPLPWRRWRVVLRVEAADEIPERLPRRGAVLVASQDHLKWIAFDCPCRERHRIMMNLDPARRPRWQVTKVKPLTLAPSVDDVTTRRRCHFFVRGGRIAWV